MTGNRRLTVDERDIYRKLTELADSGQAAVLATVVKTRLSTPRHEGSKMIVMAGGQLSGEVTDPPADWSEFNDEEIIQLETRPEDPYSVNIWMIASGPNLYVATGDDPTRWSRILEENPDVRVRIRGLIYELEAHRVEDVVEKTAIGNEYVRKYDVDDDDNWVEEGQLFRLDRR